MYKAIIELSADRAEFLSRLFARKRPANVGPKSSVADLFRAFDQISTTEGLYRQNLSDIETQLTKRHGFALSAEDLAAARGHLLLVLLGRPEHPVLVVSGRRRIPGFVGRSGGFGGNFPSYEELMLQTDMEGVNRSYLASEENFKLLKAFEEKNLIVPVVGNFAGPKALRAVGRYIRDHGAVVTAFYVSNVEQYLFQDGLFDEFARNVATLPVDEKSTFIRSVSTRFGFRGGGIGPDGRASALDPIRDLRARLPRREEASNTCGTCIDARTSRASK